ncbi:MAG: hypothetical protein U5R48_18645 [Gammaproteobacteria bacterium]|nr:hypothetical protein [Gammaproteobacteria bacterium]
MEMLPGMAGPLQRLRCHALAGRPPLEAFPPARRPLEAFVAGILEADDQGDPARPWMPSAAWRARSLDERLAALLGDRFETADARDLHRMGPHPLLRDLWTGVLLTPADRAAGSAVPAGEEAESDPEATPPPSGQLQRRPDVREALEGEDDDEDEPEAAWLIQQDEPHLHAEDPMGLQRPTDRDEETSAEEYADLASELGEARLVATPGRPKEILLSDDPPDARADAAAGAGLQEPAGIAYPEWDWRSATYRTPGATVRVRSVGAGDRTGSTGPWPATAPCCIRSAAGSSCCGPNAPGSGDRPTATRSTWTPGCRPMPTSGPASRSRTMSTAPGATPTGPWQSPC